LQLSDTANVNEYHSDNVIRASLIAALRLMGILCDAC